MRSRRSTSGFTLIELLVVVGLIAGLTFFLVRGMSGGKGAALQSAQATMANLVTAARTKAMASGCRVRILIHAKAENPQRFRRMLVLQKETSLGVNTWETPMLVTSLPEGVYVIPYQSRLPAGFFAAPGEWMKVDSSETLHSSALSGSLVDQAVDNAATESWEVVQFTPAGTLSFGAGNLLLAAGRARPLGSFLLGESPVEATDPESLRGLVLSTYGLPILASNRANF